MALKDFIFTSSDVLSEAVGGHTDLIVLPEVIFVFGTFTERGGKAYFPKCLLLISAGENVVQPAKANLEKPERPTAVAPGINSPFIEILLVFKVAAYCWAFFHCCHVNDLAEINTVPVLWFLVSVFGLVGMK